MDALSDTEVNAPLRTLVFCTDETREIRVTGRVQGVGYRPFVFKLAKTLDLHGLVANDGRGVRILARGKPEVMTRFLDLLKNQAPPLAEVRAVVAHPTTERAEDGFVIALSAGGAIATEISPDFATCPACRAETLAPGERRHGYAFTNCTHCGPRLSIIRALPYDRPNTTMAGFPLCEDCRAEYENPEDRRFHAEPIACPVCGPRLKLAHWPEGVEAAGDAMAGALAALRAGAIVAIKALGGYQLACDATNAEAVAALRAGKRRDGKPFALMARDVAVVERHAEVSAPEAALLQSREAPIVLLRARPAHGLAEAVAPGLSALGFMLPSNPLQILLFQALEMPLVMTSGNLSGDPQITEDDAARAKLGTLANFALTHDRAIANRIDDSVACVMGGAPRLIRRARGYAPAALPLPPGLENAPDLIAYGADLKATFCLISAGQAVLSAHQGDLEHAEAIEDFEKNLALYTQLYAHSPTVVAADLHEGYVSTRLALAAAEERTSVRVQHHHAHFAAVLGENAHPLGEPALGLVLDGLGLGEDGTIWGGEVLLGEYAEARRIAALRPMPLPGGDAASREPWRNLYAALATQVGWAGARASLGEHALVARLAAKPLALLDKMMAGGLNSPLSSSAGRLFDAVAGALDLSFERQRFEGEAAMHLEALAGDALPAQGYPFGLTREGEMSWLEPAPMWRALLADLATGRAAQEISGAFHAGLIEGLASIVAQTPGVPVALSGGCFQNRLLFEGLVARLEADGRRVLTHHLLPTNDGGIAYGQALVAAACAPNRHQGARAPGS